MLLTNIHQPVILKPTFPNLDSKIKAIKEEQTYLNEVLIPHMRENGFSANSGRMNWAIIQQAATDVNICPGVEKRGLRFTQYLTFKGYAVAFNESLFMEHYNETQEGRERLAVIEECERMQKGCRASLPCDPVGARNAGVLYR